MGEDWVECELGGEIGGGPHSQCRDCSHPLASRKAWRGDCARCPMPSLLAVLPVATTLLHDESDMLDQTPQRRVHNFALLERAIRTARSAVDRAKEISQ